MITCSNLPVIGGGSTTVDGPKNEGISLEVVTGVLRSPGSASISCLASTATPCSLAETGLCWLVFNRLRCEAELRPLLAAPAEDALPAIGWAATLPGLPPCVGVAV